MDAAGVLVAARKRAGLSREDLAFGAAVDPEVVARIEDGDLDPRVGLLDRLLRECGEGLVVVPGTEVSVDRDEIRQLLDLTPAERLQRMVKLVNQPL